MTNPASDVVGAARTVKHSPAGRATARVGLASRGVIYALLTVLTLQLAFVGRQGDTDQGGAFRSLGQAPGGRYLLVTLAAGIAAYVLWRWSEAALGAKGEQHQGRARVMAVIEGACYLPFGVMAVSVAFGSPQRSEQGTKYRALSAQVLSWPIGPALITATGVVIVGVGVFLASQGVRRSFLSQLELGEARTAVRRTVIGIGVVGSVGRGAVFALAGGFVAAAGVGQDAREAGGLDAALRGLARQQYGAAGLTVVAIGFAAFALFALAEAKWRVT